MEHPIERLTFKDDKLFEIYNGKVSKPFMSPSRVEVTKKLSVKEHDHHQCEFSFGLAMAADPIWVTFFREQLSEFPVEFQSERMLLLCLPGALQERYAKIKEAMARTNARYEKERDELIARVMAKDQALKAAQQQRDERTAAVNRQFDDLQI